MVEMCPEIGSEKIWSCPEAPQSDPKVFQNCLELLIGLEIPWSDLVVVSLLSDLGVPLDVPWSGSELTWSDSEVPLSGSQKLWNGSQDVIECINSTLSWFRGTLE